MKLYENAAEMDAAIIKFSKRGQSLQQEAHKIACSALLHVGKHGNINVVAKVLAGIPEMGRANALRDWFAAFGPVAFVQNAPVFVKGKPTRLGEAMDEPFWKFSPEKPYQPAEPVKMIEAMIKRLQTDQKKLKVDHSATIQALRLIKVGQTVTQAEEAEAAVVAPLMITHQPAVH